MFERIACTRPVLNPVFSRVWRSPSNPDRIYLDLAAEIERDPLRMILLTSEALREVRIAFPICIQVSIREPGITSAVTSAEPPVRERRGPGVADHLPRSRVTDEVALLSSRVAPFTSWIPVPRFCEKLCILSIADRLPTRRLDLFDELGSHDLVGDAAAQSIDARTQRTERAERTYDVRWRCIHDDLLGRRVPLRHHSARQNTYANSHQAPLQRGHFRLSLVFHFGVLDAIRGQFQKGHNRGNWCVPQEFCRNFCCSLSH